MSPMDIKATGLSQEVVIMYWMLIINRALCIFLCLFLANCCIGFCCSCSFFFGFDAITPAARLLLDKVYLLASVLRALAQVPSKIFLPQEGLSDCTWIVTF